MSPELINELQRAKAGERAAFSYVVSALHAPALRWASSLVGDPHQAEDVAQEAFVLALANLSQLEQVEAFPGWLRSLVRTAASRHRRRRQPDLYSDWASDAHSASSPGDDGLLGADPSAGPPARAETGELRALVRGAVRELRPASRDVVERYYLRGLTVDRTASELGLPVGTVKRRLHDARQRLRARLVGLTPSAADSQSTRRPSLQAPTPTKRTTTPLRFPL